ncbi:ABC transporter [Calothrix sp. HK-06]|nr:ABC transporter [Calothrix sp. HK-06]
MIVYDIQNLFKTYPRQTQPANKNISLQIYQGEIFGILGDNGAGKSTLVRQMANLVKSDSGKITFFGENIANSRHLLQVNMGYMPQESGALNNLTVSEALYFTSHLRGMSKNDAQKECEFLLNLWEIKDLRHQPSSRLSGGQRRLLRLATAMAGSPPVLILDEPTNDLDPQRRKLVWDILRRINSEQETTIILITHDAIEAEKAIQRVGIMHCGELVAVGRPSELKAKIDRTLRLELFFSPSNPPTLPPGLTCYPLESGHWRLLLQWEQVTQTLNNLNLEQIEDFRLYSATLEDLYLHYATNT